jgi:ABC-type uncharacterized transport system permease subunit
MYRLYAHTIPLVTSNLLRCLTTLKENWHGSSITLKSAKALVSACSTQCIGVGILTPPLIGNLLLI